MTVSAADKTLILREDAPPRRVSSYQRLKGRLKRNLPETVDKKNWKMPKTPNEVLQHSLRGGARAFLLAYGVRAGINFCLYLTRIVQKRGRWSRILEVSFKNLDSVRFGAMFGLFALLWKFVNNSMRLCRGKDDRLNGFVSGAIAGLSIMVEKKERRIDIAQQLFVRNGDALLYGIAGAQILYAYTMRPDTLPPDFYKFMVNAAQCPEGSLLLNAKSVRGTPIASEETMSVVKKLHPTKQALEVASGIPSTQVPVIPCEVIHPWNNSCCITNIERFIKVFKAFLPVYGTLHFVPMLLLRRKHFISDPGYMIKKTAISTLRSGAFMASFITLYQTAICMHRQIVKTGWIGNWNPKYLYFLAGVFNSYPAIFFEEKKRRSELALYILPKAFYSFYHIAYSHSWIFKLKHFEVVMTSIAMAIIMSFYQEEKDVLSSFVQKIMYQFFEKN
ncbi:hypothetical protein BDF20DRAFT_907926 [Mycotypha africana]|uniref:uncharacterized protein n=1 Tax=Mycotypha africana TaxID=64632 RepID=UPI002301D463|nr:uncharacterized protein BDF20DRAFT_907926 [Mycotypha africana]KAI8969195.1 hypothetical protein BDF20DRAFT_907926 [Mycotypha africana]